MAKEYIVINNHRQNEGLIALSKHVLESIVKYSFEEEKNCSIAQKEGPFNSPVMCKVNKNKLEIAINLKIKYGINVNEICELLQEKVKNTIYLMTDIKCNDIEMNVVGFIF